MLIPLRIFFLAVILFALSGFSIEDAPNDEVINWEESRKLSWDDFQGTPPFGYLFHAETFTGIGYSYTPVRKGNRVYIEWDVHCYFDKNRSWVRNDSKMESLLRHEQGHFDITELYAREFRKVLKSTYLDIDNVKEVIEYEYQMVLKEMHEFHNAYDKSTEHGINTKEQAEWDSMIQDQLDNLYAFTGS